MAKQQTLTILVADDMDDPADVVKRALTNWYNQPPIDLGRIPAEEAEAEFRELSPVAFAIIEED